MTPAVARSRMSSHIRRRLRGSRPVVGSSTARVGRHQPAGRVDEVEPVEKLVDALPVTATADQRDKMATAQGVKEWCAATVRYVLLRTFVGSPSCREKSTPPPRERAGAWGLSSDLATRMARTLARGT